MRFIGPTFFHDTYTCRLSDPEIFFLTEVGRRVSPAPARLAKRAPGSGMRKGSAGGGAQRQTSTEPVPDARVASRAATKIAITFD
jgi:hypothetical protein